MSTNLTTSEMVERAKEDFDAVYDAGYEKGKAEGSSSDDNLKAFWTEYQDSGTRTNYVYAFAGSGWTNDTFKPQYDIKPTSSTMYMFGNSQIDGDLTAHLESCGIILDLSNATNVNNIFSASQYITRLPRIDIRNATNAINLFTNCTSLQTIDALVVGDKNTNASGWFTNCTSLESVTFEGNIFANIDLKRSTKLNRASIESVIAALSTIKSGGTLTISKTAKEAAFTDAEWATLTATKPGWTITLV